jgi:MoxR-like ATPase
MQPVQEFVDQVVDNVEKVIVGKRPVIELLMVALLCEGHVLLEDVPGTGKTMLARSIAISLGGQFKRLQCTPDLLPNDVTGVSVFNQSTAEFDFRPGPIFVNILLADEINRATPRTQSALLEAMQEQQVTVDGVTRPLPRPFMVLATQNPIEFEGTFPLPEAQLDRFLMRLSLGYPAHADERLILTNLQREHPITHLQPVVFEYRDPLSGRIPDGSREPIHAGDGKDLLLSMQKLVWEVHVDDSLQDYIVRLVGGTRTHADLLLGGSPRASLALFKTAQALAAVRGRDHVIPDDVKYLVPFTLAHRLIVRPESELRGRTAAVIILEVLAGTSLELVSNG